MEITNRRSHHAEQAGAAEVQSQRGRPGRRTADDRVQAVLELLAGKSSIQQLAMRFGVLEETVVKWRDEAVESMTTGFRRGNGKSQRARQQGWEQPRGPGRRSAVPLLAVVAPEPCDRALSTEALRDPRGRLGG